MLEDYYYSSIAELSLLIRQQRVSPVAVVNGCLRRIESLNPKLNAFITVLADQGLRQAREAEAEIQAGRWLGPLHGIPLGIKDFYDTAGIPTTAAFEHFRARVPSKDATSVAKLKQAGAIVIGKMNMHELGMGTTSLASYYGPVHNPWDGAYIAGGSSGGSAAAVASGMCYATLDTDAIGSCRLPAACCGVVGFKGTYGLISSQGILEGEKADEMILLLSHPGITTRSVEDTALVLSVLAESNDETKPAEFSPELDPGRKNRLGVVSHPKADAAVTAAFDRAVETIRSLGYPLVPAAAPSADLSRGISSIEADREAIAGQAFKEIDILILPTTTTMVPSISEAGADPQALSPENTLFANYYGLPAISIPCGWDAHGLPLGLQLVGKPGDENAVLAIAYRFQKMTEYGRRHPIP